MQCTLAYGNVKVISGGSDNENQKMEIESSSSGMVLNSTQNSSMPELVADEGFNFFAQQKQMYQKNSSKIIRHDIKKSVKLQQKRKLENNFSSSASSSNMIENQETRIQEKKSKPFKENSQ